MLVTTCKADGAALYVLPVFILQASLSLVPFMGACLWPTSFPEHPVPDIRRTVQHRDALRLTRVEKANTFDIYEIHFLQIQSYSCSESLDLCLHLIKVLRSKRSAQPNHRSALTRNSFNPQSHGSLVRSTLLRMQRLGH